MLANRAGEGEGGEGRRGGLINSISQASAFFTDVRSIFLPFLRGWRLIVENRSVVIGKLDSREKKSSYSFEVNIHSSDPNRSEKHRRKKIVRVIFPTSFTSFDSILPFCSSFFLYIYISLSPLFLAGGRLSFLPLPPPRVDHYGEAASFHVDRR